MTRRVRGTIDPRVPRDLETIVLKSIEKDPRARYATADALAEDLRRFLDDEPILARRASPTEKYVRSARRNPLIAGLAASLLVFLVVALAVSMVVAGRMSRAAENERDARIVADKARSEADRQRSQAEANFQRALGTVDQYFTQVSESQLLTVPGLQPLRKDLLKSALMFYEDYLKTRKQDPALRSALAAVHLKAAKIQSELADPARAKAEYQGAASLFEARLEGNVAEPPILNDLAECYLGLGKLAVANDERRNHFVRSVSIREKLAQESPGDNRFREDMSRSYEGLAKQDLAERHTRDALMTFMKAHDIQASLVRNEPDRLEYNHDFASTLGQIAECLCAIGRHQNESMIRPLAIEHARFAFEHSPQHVAYGRLFGGLCMREGSNLWSQFQRDESRQSYRKAITAQRALIRENPELPGLYSDFVQTYASMIRGVPNAERLQLLDEACNTVGASPQKWPALIARANLLALRAATLPDAQSTNADTSMRRTDADQAVDALRRGIAAGYRNKTDIETSPYLANLRARDDFKQMIRELEKSPVTGPAVVIHDESHSAGAPPNSPPTRGARRALFTTVSILNWQPASMRSAWFSLHSAIVSMQRKRLPRP